MFSHATIHDVRVDPRAAYVAALVDKLTDLDRRRIHSGDDLVLRKAVLGLLEIVADLEQRLAALEGPGERAAADRRLSEGLRAASPDQIRLGEAAPPGPGPQN